MKLKGISSFEQHVEKIVLALMVAILLGVISMQFLHHPNQVEIGGRKVAPEMVFGELRKEVDRLKAQVNDTDPELPKIETPDLVSEYERVTSASGGLPGELAVAFGKAPRIGGGIDIGPVAEGPMMAMFVPAPEELAAHAQWNSMDPYAIEDNPDLARYIPAEQPFDVPGVSIAGVIDGREMQEVLRTGDGAHRPINASWVRGAGVAVLGVEAERERLLPDGSWGEAQLVAPIAGSFDLYESMGIEGDPDPSELRQVVAEAEKFVDEIARPAYIPVIAGPEWLEPMEAIERDEQVANMSDVDLLRHRRRSNLRKIDQLLRQLNEDPDARRTRDTGGSNQFITPGKGGGRDPGGRRDPSAQERDRERQQRAEERRREQINKRIESLEQEIERIEQELADRGFPVAGREEDQLASEPTIDPELERAQRTLLGNEAFKVWVHDLEVEPGATYRYRLRVKVNNPIYGKDRLLDPEVDDLELAKQAYAYSAWSRWSEPVIVGQQTYVFLTGGNEAARRSVNALTSIGGTSAKVSAEVYHMYYGHYRLGMTTLEPSDVVYAQVRVPEGLYLFDTELVSRDEAYRLAGVIPDRRRGLNPRPAGPRPGLPGAPSQEFITQDPRDVQPGFDPRNPQAPRRVEPEVPEELPEGVTEAPRRIEVARALRLLDVVELPIELPGGAADGKSMVYAYFETEDGRVEYRRVDLDTQTREYELVRSSYLLGEPEEEEESP